MICLCVEKCNYTPYGSTIWKNAIIPPMEAQYKTSIWKKCAGTPMSYTTGASLWVDWSHFPVVLGEFWVSLGSLLPASVAFDVVGVMVWTVTVGRVLFPLVVSWFLVRVVGGTSVLWCSVSLGGVNASVTQALDILG